jgi:DNA polymerase I-like protein with 3'-5' exonuclease and polymerase domains
MCKIVAIDTETLLFEPYNMAPTVICMSTCIDGVNKIYTDKKLENELLYYFTQNYLIVGHNIAYDMSCLIHTFPDLNNFIWTAYENNQITDTGLRERLLDIADGHFRSDIDEEGNKTKSVYSLAELSRKYFKEILEKGENTWRKKFNELAEIPLSQWPKEAVDYALKDAENTYHIYKRQRVRAYKESYTLPTEFEESRADFCLKLMSAWGIKIDTDKVDDLWNTSCNRMEILAKDLIASGIAEKKKNKNIERYIPSIKQNLKITRNFIEQSYKSVLIPRTPKGEIKTDEKVLKDCDLPVLKNMLEFKKLQKTCNTYLTKMQDGIIHTSFWAIGAESNRTSSSNPNLQNLPRLPGVRECFIPREGHVFLSCDFDAQEMRTLAQTCLDICGYSRLSEAYQKNRHFDPHMEFALSLGDEKYRQYAKTANFGFPGGLSADSFVSYANGRGIEITREEAYKLRNNWFKQWPEMNDYFTHIQSLVGWSNYGKQIIPQSGFI